MTLCLMGQIVLGQDLIKLTNGKSFFTEIQSVDKESVVYQIGKRKVTLPTEEIALIEYLEGGVEYYNMETLQIINPDSIVYPLQRGHNVYVPFSSENVTKRSGALKLRELAQESMLWHVVDCEEEAHFIMEFVYSDIGKDHGFINMKDRCGKVLYQTREVYNSDFNPVHKGEELAEELFTKHIRTLYNSN